MIVGKLCTGYFVITTFIISANCDYTHHGHDHESSADMAAATALNSTYSSVDDKNLTASDNRNISQPKSAQGSIASRVVSHNEYCDPSIICNATQNLKCEDSRCKCRNDNQSPIPNTRLVFGRNADKCVPISGDHNGWSCMDNIQCTNSSYGIYSRCNLTSGISNYGVCECHDTEGQQRKFITSDKVCILKKQLDQSCTTNKECDDSILGEAICQGSDEISERKGVCKCAARHFFNSTLEECLRIGFINSPCKVDSQCSHVEGLGSLARCRDDWEACSCYDVPGNGEKKAGFHEGRCYYFTKANETCSQKIECTLGYHTDADCLPHPSYNGEKVCQCTEGNTCINSGFIMKISFVLIIFSGIFIQLL